MAAFLFPANLSPIVIAYFLSDIHLTDSVSPSAMALRAFLRRLLDQRLQGGDEAPTHLFLVGDIFDLWVGSHRYFIEKFAPLIDQLHELVRRGVEVHFFEGNHDLHLREFWQDELGVIVHEDAELFELAGWRVRVEHGDLMNPADHGYLFLRRLLRRPWVRFLALRLPDGIVRRIGEMASAASRTYTSTAKELPTERIRQIIRAHAERQARVDDFDLLISGHVHTVDDFQFECGGKNHRSVNLGAWFDGPKAFRLRPKAGEFISLD